MSAERAQELNRLLLQVRSEQRAAEHRLAKLLAELGTNSRVLERAVSLCSSGDLPPPVEPELRGQARRRLVFELEGPEADVVQQALTWVRTQADRGGRRRPGAIGRAVSDRGSDLPELRGDPRAGQ